MFVFSFRFYVLLGLGLIPLSLSWSFPVLRQFVFAYDTLIFLLAIVDYFISRRDGQKIQVERKFDSRFAIGDKTKVTLHIENLSSRDLTIHIKDERPPQMRIEGQIDSIVKVNAGLYAEVSYGLTPPRRGRYDFGAIGIRFLSRLGLVWCQTKVEKSVVVKVYPSIRRAKEMELKSISTQSFMMTQRKSLRRGEGREFESLRDYVYGDEFRNISWTATARRAKLTTKQYQVERNQTIIIALDAGRLMTGRVENETKFDIALHASLALMLTTTRIGDNAGLLIFGRKIKRFIPPDKGYTHVDAVLEATYDLEPELIEPSYSRAFHFIASNVKKRALIVVLTDLIDKESSNRLLRALKLLRPRHLPLVVTIGDKDLNAVVSSIPKNPKEIFIQSAAEEIIQHRETALRMVESIGGLALDVTTSNLAPKLIETYLKIKEKSLI